MESISSFVNELSSVSSTNPMPLRIDTTSLNRDIARHRPCDQAGTTYYCREWAQLAYKRRINPPPPITPAQKKDKEGVELDPGNNVKTPSKTLRDYYKEACDATDPRVPLVTAKLQDVLDYSLQWKQKICAYTPVMEPFRRVQPLPAIEDEIMASSIPNDPIVALLDTSMYERGWFTLPVGEYQHLLHMTHALIKNLAEADCGHKKNRDSTPSELDNRRDIFHEHLLKVGKSDMEELRKLLQHVWRRLVMFTDAVKGLEEARHRLLLPCVNKTLGHGTKGQNDVIFISFADYWQPFAETFKKKKSQDVRAVDQAFEMYLKKQMIAMESFNIAFQGIYDAFTTDMSMQLETAVKEALVRCEEDDEYGVKEAEKLRASAAATLNTALPRLKKDLNELADFNVAANAQLEDDVTLLRQAFTMESRMNVGARLDKAANKEFRKMIKRAENAQQQHRSRIMHELSKVLTTGDMVHIASGVLAVLATEGEQRETKAVRKHRDTNKNITDPLDAIRNELEASYRQGIKNGKRELAALMGRLYLLEGKRLMENYRVEKNMDVLLKEVKQMDESKGPSKKKKKKKSKASISVVDDDMDDKLSGTSTPLEPEIVNGDTKKASPSVLATFASKVVPQQRSKPVTLPTEPTHWPSLSASPKLPNAKPQKGGWASVAASITPPAKVDDSPIASEEEQPVKTTRQATPPVVKEEPVLLPQVEEELPTPPEHGTPPVTPQVGETPTEPTPSSSTPSPAPPKSQLPEAHVLLLHIQRMESERQALIQEFARLNTHTSSLQENYNKLADICRAQDEELRGRQHTIESLHSAFSHREQQLVEALNRVKLLEAHVQSIETLKARPSTIGTSLFGTSPFPTAPTTFDDPLGGNKWNNAVGGWSDASWSTAQQPQQHTPPLLQQDMWTNVNTAWNMGELIAPESKAPFSPTAQEPVDSTPSGVWLPPAKRNPQGMDGGEEPRAPKSTNPRRPTVDDSFRKPPPPGFDSDKSKWKEAGEGWGGGKSVLRRPTKPARPILRCANCGEAGHESEQCTLGCRYCQGTHHSSECEQLNRW